MCLHSIPAPVLPTSGTKASQSCITPCAHTGTRLLRLFCKHWLKHTEGRFFAPVWFTQHCLWPVFPKQGKSTGPILMPLLRLGSHPNINPNTTMQDRAPRSLTTTSPSHNHMASDQAFTKVSQTQLWGGGGRCRLESLRLQICPIHS